MSSYRKGSCLCGAVTVNLKLKGDTFGACHCGMCRKWAGSSALAVEGTDVSFIGQDFISVFSSSEWGERGFCKQCGTHLFFRLKSGDFINFPIGLIEDVDHLKFAVQIFIDCKPKNYSFAEPTKMMTEKEFLKDISNEQN